AKKILEHNRNKERRKEEKEIKARQERIRQAQEARKKEEQEEKKNEAFLQHAGNAGGSSGFNMPKGFEKIFQDSEVMNLLQDEGVLAAYMDIINNPANIAKHMSNPKVMKLFSKIGNATGGFGMDSGKPEMKETTAKDETTTDIPPPNKAPEPDLD
ncbi:hypothetical protein X798_01512, partial [Onchocerca flexuosa]